MKITRIGPSFPLLTASTLGGGGGTISPSVGGGLVPVSNGSNGWAWGSNVERITAGGSNVTGPYVNFASGSNVTLTIDQAGAVGSNTVRIHATTGAASFGSNSNAVSQANAPGASTDSSRADHVHLGVTSLAHSSNTFSGPVILTTSGTLGITSPVAGTYNLSSTGGSSSVSAGSNSTRVQQTPTAGASTTLWSPFDHAHDGIGTITASSSNTLQRGTVNLRSGNNISFGLTDTDGNGEFDTVTINGVATGGGSSGVSWTQGISESGASFANFTANSGTWSSNGTEIIQTAVGGLQRRARHNTLVPGALTWLLETELFFVTTGTGNIRAGLLVGDPADAGHMWVYVERLGTGQVAVEREGAVQIKTYATTVAHSTWYKLRVGYNGVTVTTWLDGTLLGTTLMTPREDEVYPQLGTYDASVKFRNFKVWTLSGGLPA